MFKVTLSAAANPDYEISSYNGSVQIGQQVKAVSSVRQASRGCSEFIQENELGGGNWTGGKLFTEEGREIGHISYNGRAWDRNGVEIELDANPLNFSIKDLRPFKSENSYQGDLFINGDKIAEFINNNTGGLTFFRFTSPEAEHRLGEYIRKTDFNQQNPEHNLICRLLDWEKEFEQLKRDCESETLFKLHDDDKDMWRTLKAPYDARAKDWLQKNYGSQIAEVANERFEPVPAPQSKPSLGM